MNLIAHRANDNHNYLENTKEAVIHCLNCEYIYGIEIDVRITKDKKVVVIHNLLIDLLSNGSGFVKDKSLKELKKYTFGYNQKISTLEEILKIMNNKLLLIEVKEEGKNFKETSTLIYEIIKKYSHLKIMVCSFNYELLKYIKLLDKSVECGLIIGSILNRDKIYNHLNYNILSMKQLKKAKENDFVWTINNKENYNKIKHQNINLNVITDVAYKLF